jgi:nucleoside-triphosphatase
VTAPTLKLLLTGDPGCGKTTVVHRVVERLRGSVPLCGFLTEEVGRGGRRRGFQGRTFDGRTFPLADRDFDSDLRVGPYGVTLDGLETVGLDSLRAGPETRLIVLDEVGKMELLSAAFRRRVEELLAAETALLATVSLHGVGFVKQVRQDPRVTLVRMRRRGRGGMVGEILRRLAEAGIGPGPAKNPGTGRRSAQTGSSRP